MTDPVTFMGIVEIEILKLSEEVIEVRFFFVILEIAGDRTDLSRIPDDLNDPVQKGSADAPPSYGLIHIKPVDLIFKVCESAGNSSDGVSFLIPGPDRKEFIADLDRR